MRRNRQFGSWRETLFQVQLQAIEVGMMVLILAARARGDSRPADAAASAPPAAEKSERRIVVSIPDCRLALIEDGRVVRIYQVAVGAPVSPSPAGQFHIVQRVTDPAYYHPGVVIPAGADNPVGPRWIGLNAKGYGIHGTNQPGSIGHHASHGCIRMRNADVKELFELVQEGDPVELHGERDAETKELFGDGEAGLESAAASSDGQVENAVMSAER